MKNVVMYFRAAAFDEQWRLRHWVGATEKVVDPDPAGSPFGLVFRFEVDDDLVAVPIRLSAGRRHYPARRHDLALQSGDTEVHWVRGDTDKTGTPRPLTPDVVSGLATPAPGLTRTDLDQSLEIAADRLGDVLTRVPVRRELSRKDLNRSVKKLGRQLRGVLSVTPDRPDSANTKALLAGVAPRVAEVGNEIATAAAAFQASTGAQLPPASDVMPVAGQQAELTPAQRVLAALAEALGAAAGLRDRIAELASAQDPIAEDAVRAELRARLGLVRDRLNQLATAVAQPQAQSPDIEAAVRVLLIAFRGQTAQAFDRAETEIG